jgi:hypothetical protein
LHPRFPEVVEDHRREVAPAGLLLAGQLRRRPLLFGRDDPVGREALDRERAADPNSALVFIGLIKERLGLGVAADGGVDLGAGHAFADVGIVGD